MKKVFKRIPRMISMMDSIKKKISNRVEGKFSFPSFLLKSVLVCSRFLCRLHFSLIAPLFPAIAKAKDVDQVMYGLIYSSQPLMSLFSSLLAAKFILRLGAGKTFMISTAATGIASVCFGFTQWVPAGVAFIGVCLTLRMLDGASAGINAYSVKIVSSSAFPNRLATVNGMCKTAGMVGFLLGPQVGALLYTLGGYGTPFFLSGELLLVTALVTTIAYLLMPRLFRGQTKEEEEEDKDKISFVTGQRPKYVRHNSVKVRSMSDSDFVVNELPEKSLDAEQKDVTKDSADKQVDDEEVHLRNAIKMLYHVPSIQVYTLVNIMIQAGLSFMQSAYTPYLAEFTSPTVLAGMFTGSAVASLVLATPVGYISDKYPKSAKYILVLCTIATFISLLFMGPSPLLGGFIPNDSIICAVFVMTTLGLSTPAVIVIFPDMLKSVLAADYPNNATTKALVGVIDSTSKRLSETLTPFISGFLVKYLGFAWSATIMTGLVAITLFIEIMFFVIREKSRKMYDLESARKSGLLNDVLISQGYM